MRKALYLDRMRIQPRPTAARLSSGSLADFLARKYLADFLLEALLDFLAVGFAYTVCNILSYHNITNLPIAKKSDCFLPLLVPFREVYVIIKTQQPLWKSFFY